MAAFCPLLVTQDLPTLRAKLQGLLRFLRDALSISNAHTVDFYTESVWEELVDLSPETVLAALRRPAAQAEAEAEAEAEARLCEVRPLAEVEKAPGEWQPCGKGSQAEGPACKLCPLVEADRNRVSGGRERGRSGARAGPESAGRAARARPGETY